MTKGAIRMKGMKHLLGAGLLLAAVAPALLLAQGTSQVLAKVKSEYQEITVLDTPYGFRRMIFDAKLDGTDAIQSEMKKSMPTELTLAYSRHMMAALPLVEKTGRDEQVLVIGLGGACMQRYLYELLPKATIQSAELDPAVVDMAKRFFNYVPDARQKISVGDGRKFVETTNDKYDLLLLDAFSATSIPYPLATEEFLKACKSRLNPGGLVAANLWSNLPEYPDMLKTYDAVFPEWHLLRCGGGSSNVILIALADKRGLTREKWSDLAKAYEKSHGMTVPIGQMVGDNYLVRPELGSGAKVLVDKK